MITLSPMSTLVAERPAGAPIVAPLHLERT